MDEEQVPPHHLANRTQAVGKAEQIQLQLTYRRLLDESRPLPALHDVGFTNFSQFDEDGLLLFIFAIIGSGNRRCVEICAGVGSESMSANLILNHQWDALQVDGNPDNVNAARAFFAGRSETFWQPPQVIRSWVTRDNVNELFTRTGFDGEIDLLALDMDGVEFHVWESLTATNPRVLVTEINDLWPAETCVTVRYRDDFRCRDDQLGYCGASLGAWVKSCRKRGYRLVGCNRNGLNCFFVRNDQAPDLLPEVDPASCLSRRATQAKQEQFKARIADYDWITV